MAKFILLRSQKPQAPWPYERPGSWKKREAGPREVEREELKSTFLGILESLRQPYVRSVGTMHDKL
ncbi:MAG: hypothetical protein V3R78_08505, partial [Thermodesulfobacteriota bacterium]